MRALPWIALQRDVSATGRWVILFPKRASLWNAGDLRAVAVKNLRVRHGQQAFPLPTQARFHEDGGAERSSQGGPRRVPPLRHPKARRRTMTCASSSMASSSPGPSPRASPSIPRTSALRSKRKTTRSINHQPFRRRSCSGRSCSIARSCGGSARYCIQCRPAAYLGT
jgi:hypothetical protein